MAALIDRFMWSLRVVLFISAASARHTTSLLMQQHLSLITLSKTRWEPRTSRKFQLSLISCPLSATLPEMEQCSLDFLLRTLSCSSSELAICPAHLWSRITHFAAIFRILSFPCTIMCIKLIRRASRKWYYQAVVSANAMFL